MASLGKAEEVGLCRRSTYDIKVRICLSDQFEDGEFSRHPVLTEVVFKALEDFAAASVVGHIGDLLLAHGLIVVPNKKRDNDEEYGYRSELDFQR